MRNPTYQKSASINAFVEIYGIKEASVAQAYAIFYLNKKKLCD